MSGQDTEFTDYYRILQVHQDAEPEIVKSAYRRLAQMNHPDLHPSLYAMKRMQLINQAYATISDAELRRAYHQVWLQHNRIGHREEGIFADRPGAEAQEALDTYFRCILKEDWVSAYAILTQKDCSLVSLEDFCEWKEAVKVLYQMGSYAIKSFRAYERCVVGETEYEKVHVFSVFLTDRDKRTGKISEETYTKYVAWDGNEWHVCLGHAQLKPIIYKMKYLATQAPELDPGRVYMDTVLKFDKLTGLLSRKGLIERLDQEIARVRRFRGNLCLTVISIDPAGDLPDTSSFDYMLMCLAQAAQKLKNCLRTTDCAARFSDNQLAVLLIETEHCDAGKALKRFLRVVQHEGEGVVYRVEGSITSYQGETAEDSVLRAEQDACTFVTTGEDNIKKTHIRLDDQQV